jgi:hypothetical protein
VSHDALVNSPRDAPQHRRPAVHRTIGWTLVIVGLIGEAAAGYSATSALLVIAAFAALIVLPVADPVAAPEAGRRDQWTAAVPPIAFAVIVAVGCAANLRSESPRANGPFWTDNLCAARAACAGPAGRRHAGYQPARLMEPSAVRIGTALTATMAAP